MAVVLVENLDKRFGSTHAVRGLSLSVEAGQIFGLLGPNGSGKTTTLAITLGLLRPDGGKTSVLGVPSHRIHETRGRVAAVFDGPGLVPNLTGLQNLRYAEATLGHRGGRPAHEALELVDMTEHAGRRAGHMSLGQRRRISIARALLGKPELIVLDEPLSGLDPVGVTRMLELFRRLRDDGQTLVLSTHRLHEMEQVVTHVGILAAGRMIRAGALSDVLGSSEGLLRIQATPVDRARELLSAMDGVRLADTASARDGEIVVRAPTVPSARLNRALVEAGCEVTALIPERATLPSLFSSLVQEAPA